MPNDKLTRWVGPPPTELAPLENSISSELSYGAVTYTQLREPDIRDILAEGRDVVVKGLNLSRKVRATILEALMFAYEQESNIDINDIDEAKRALMGVD